MELTIISPHDRQEQIVVWLDVTTLHGNFVIKDGHAPMIIDLLPEHTFTFALENGIQKSIMVRRGLLRVNRTHAIIIMSAPEHG